MAEVCGSNDQSLCGKTTIKGPLEVTSSTFNPQTIGGIRPGEGDTHGDDELIVCCPSEE